MPASASRSATCLGFALALACGTGERAGAPAADGQSSPATTSAVGAAPCSPSGAAFCWVNPIPQGTPVVALAPASGGGAWGVGADGTALRLSGDALAPVALPTRASLRAAWTAPEGDTWAVGDAVLRHDARGWAVVDAPAGAWSAVHGSGARDVWAVGDGGAAAHWDGAAWQRVDTGTASPLVAVAARAAGDAWALAQDGATFRWDGARWSPGPAIALRSARALLATASGDLWAAGAPLPRGVAGSTGLARLAGAGWEPVAVPGLAAETFTALAVAPDGAVWAGAVSGAGKGAVARFDGAWSVEALPDPSLPVRAVQALPGGELVTGGDGGQVFVRTGGSWSPVHRGPPGALQAGAATAAGEVWFGALAPDYAAADPQASLLRLSGGAVAVVPTGLADVLYGVWANAPDDVWVGTLQNGFLHYDGQRWMPRYAGSAGLVDGVWASGPADVWGAAGATAVHFDGQRVTEWPLPGDGARRIFGTSPRDVWAVGAAGAVYRFDGARWTALAIPGGPGLAVWGSAPDDVWVVGAEGLALHFDGAAFTRVETGTRAALWAVGGTGRGEVWAAGDGGTVLHLAGGRFERVESGTDNALGAIVIDPAGDVYVAGDFGTILRKPSR
jgi:hypothetical protein